MSGGEFDRIPPHDLGAEQCVLGGMLMSRDAIYDVAGTITAGDHYRPAHQIIHEAIMSLHAAGEPVDAVTVSNLLIKRGELAQAGGGTYLHTILAAVPTAASAGYYARIVRDRAVLRRLVEAGTRAVQLGYAADGDAGELVGRARAELDAVDAPLGSGPAEPLDQLFADVYESLSKQEPRGVLTPWADVNELTGGFGPGEMIVIAASTGIGKSVTGLGVAAHAALRLGVPSVLFSMEMPRQEIMMRLISAEARVPLWNMMRRQLTDDDWRRITAVRAEIVDAPLSIEYVPVCTVEHIGARLREMSRDRPAGLAVVDYLQLMTSHGRHENRQVEVAGFAKGLQILAGQHAIPVLALSQLNRNPAHRGERRPELSDIRESGAIEQAASMVVLLYREDADNRESPRAGEIDLIFAKNRNGPPATITAAFQGHYARIMDMSRAVDTWTPSQRAQPEAA